jgi:hypothetical protein
VATPLTHLTYVPTAAAAPTTTTTTTTTTNNNNKTTVMMMMMIICQVPHTNANTKFSAVHVTYYYSIKSYELYPL